MIRELTTYIATQASLTIGSDLFATDRPEDAEAACSVVIDRPSASVVHSTTRTSHMVQVLSRSGVNGSWVDAETLATNLYVVLQGLRGVTLPLVDSGSQYYIEVCNAVSKPQPLGRDARGRFEYSTNYLVRIKES